MHLCKGNFYLQGVLKNLKKPEGKDMNLNEGDNAPPPPPPPEKPLEKDVDLEGGYPKKIRKLKTSQNDSSHGSFFLRVGAIGEFRLCCGQVVTF